MFPVNNPEFLQAWQQYSAAQQRARMQNMQAAGGNPFFGSGFSTGAQSVAETIVGGGTTPSSLIPRSAEWNAAQGITQTPTGAVQQAAQTQQLQPTTPQVPTPQAPQQQASTATQAQGTVSQLIQPQVSQNGMSSATQAVNGEDPFITQLKRQLGNNFSGAIGMSGVVGQPVQTVGQQTYFSDRRVKHNISKVR